MGGIGNFTLDIASPLSYLIAFALPMFDAVLPIVPSETVLIALGVATAGSSDPRIFLLVLFAAVGAWTGDNLSYVIGQRFGPWVTRRFFASGKGAQRREWAEQSLERFGMGLIIVCRFIPGGRTAVTLSCGIIGYSWRRFTVAAALAGALWAAYNFFAGRLGGKAFENNPVLGFGVAFGGALVLSGLVEVLRRIFERRGKKRDAARHEEPPGHND